METLLVVASSVSVVVSVLSLIFSIKRMDKEKIIQQACDFAQAAQKQNQKNGYSLSSSDKKRVAMEYARNNKVKFSPQLLSQKIQAQLQRRTRNA